MRYAILSDIHGNFEALKAVLEGLESEHVDAYVCLGDIVGYGPEPAECVREVRRLSSTVIAGNHDLAVCGRVSAQSFNVYAREAIGWTRQVLGGEDLEYLGQLPLAQSVDGMELAHGTLYAPELFDYLQTSYDAYLSMEEMKGPVCFVGHSHVPVSFVRDEIICYRLDAEVPVDPEGRVIVNVGSVGQPRDKDPRACYAVYDTERCVVRIHRARYDVNSVSLKIKEVGLPAALGERLRLGR